MLGRDIFQAAADNLRQRKLRTFLTTSGVTIGIGALVAMISFGAGIEKNLSDRFTKMELFNSLTVTPKGTRQNDFGPGRQVPAKLEPGNRPLDKETIAAIGRIPGVKSVFPDIQIPAQVTIGSSSQFQLLQGFPASFSAGPSLRLKEGRPFRSDDEEAAIVSAGLFRRKGDPVPKTITIATMDFNPMAMVGLAGQKQGNGQPPLPLQKREYTVPVIGISEESDFGGGPVRSYIFGKIGVKSFIITLGISGTAYQQ